MSDELTALRARVGELEILVKQWREYACGQRADPPGEADTNPLVDPADLYLMDKLARGIAKIPHGEFAAAWFRIRQALHPQGEG